MGRKQSPSTKRLRKRRISLAKRAKEEGVTIEHLEELDYHYPDRETMQSPYCLCEVCMANFNRRQNPL